MTKAALFEPEPKKPVELIFTIGRDFEATLHSIKLEIRKKYTKEQLELIVEYDDYVKKCARIVVNVGRGIVLWDKTRMTPYEDDPFLLTPTARAWILKILKERLPDLMGAATMAHKQNRRMKRMSTKYFGKAGIPSPR
jgi:hypothetical protein